MTDTRAAQPAPFRIVVLASTNGTDLQAIIDEIKAGTMPNIELIAVISNKKDCYALERARAQGYKAMFVDPQSLTREQYDEKLLATIEPLHPDLIVLVGYMRILMPTFVRAFPHRIINVHPALMPKFSGKDFYGTSVHEAVIKAGETETGMTIHYVDEGVDTGEIIMQKKITIAPDDTSEMLKEKVQSLEKKYYPEVIRQLAAKHSTPYK